MGLNINDITDFISNDDTLQDQSVAVTTGGNFERKRLPIGTHPIRLSAYIELGVQAGGMYDGKPKPDEDQARMTFEFLGKRTVEENDDGKVFAPRKSLTKKLSMHTKAGFYKLFLQMRGGDSSITHMAQMIGKQAWLVDVVWRTMGDDGKYITIKKKDVAHYEERLKEAKTDKEKKDFRIFDNVEWNTIRAPFMPILDEDGEDTGEVKAIKVRELVGDVQLFLWDNPKPMFWDSLFIEGTYTKKVGDKEEEVSKNYLQEAIMGAKNFEGSALEAMLGGVDNLSGVVDTAEGDSDVGKSSAQTDADDQSAPTETGDSATGATTSPSEEVDEMDELGL